MRGRTRHVVQPEILDEQSHRATDTQYVTVTVRVRAQMALVSRKEASGDMRRLKRRSPGSYGVMIGPVDDHKPPASHHAHALVPHPIDGLTIRPTRWSDIMPLKIAFSSQKHVLNVLTLKSDAF